MYYHIEMGKIKIKGELGTKDLLVLFVGLTLFVLSTGIIYVYLLKQFNII